MGAPTGANATHHKSNRPEGPGRIGLPFGPFPPIHRSPAAGRPPAPPVVGSASSGARPPRGRSRVGPEPLLALPAEPHALVLRKFAEAVLRSCAWSLIPARSSAGVMAAPRRWNAASHSFSGERDMLEVGDDLGRKPRRSPCDAAYQAAKS